MKKRFIFFAVLTMICSQVFAKNYHLYTWARGKPYIFLEVYYPYDENIGEKAVKKLDEIEEFMEKAAINSYNVTYIGSISEPSYQVHRTFSSVSAYIDIYNKCGEKNLWTEINVLLKVKYYIKILGQQTAD